MLRVVLRASSRAEPRRELVSTPALAPPRPLCRRRRLWGGCVGGRRSAAAPAGRLGSHAPARCALYCSQIRRCCWRALPTGCTASSTGQ
jgi:hypothetical protein